MQRKTAHDYCALADKRGYFWLGPFPENTKSKVGWQCSAGHLWQATYNGIWKGKGCPHCAGHAPKTEADCHAIASTRGFYFRGPLPLNIQDKVGWECPSGHLWQSAIATIRRRNCGCPYCAGVAPKTEDDYSAVGSANGLRFIGPLSGNTLSKVWWECSRLHRWQASYSSIRAGRGCPECLHFVNGAQVSKPQLALAVMIGGKINVRVKRYSIDVALIVNGINIGIEYDCAYFHDATHDAKRDAFLIGAGWRILRVRAARKLPNQGQLNKAIERLLTGSTMEVITLDDWSGESQ